MSENNEYYNENNTCSWYIGTSLISQLVKNPLAMQETPVRFLGWGDPLEKGEAAHSSVLRLRWQRICP